MRDTMGLEAAPTTRALRMRAMRCLFIVALLLLNGANAFRSAQASRHRLLNPTFDGTAAASNNRPATVRQPLARQALPTTSPGASLHVSNAMHPVYRCSRTRSSTFTHASSLLPSAAATSATSSQLNALPAGLATVSLPSQTLRAALALLLSSAVGIRFDAVVPGAGILGTLLTAAFFSNLGLIPTAHFLYDLCWTLFLPASLALLLLAFRTPDSKDLASQPPQPTTSESSDNVNARAPPAEEPIAVSIRAVAIPFLVASVSSLLGCLVSYLLIKRIPSIALPMRDAQVATGCLSASLVGGSVNFFATARLVAAPASLLGSLATADLMIMAVYFAFLTAALQSPSFRNLFVVPSDGRSKSREVAASELGKDSNDDVCNDGSSSNNNNNNSIIGAISSPLPSTASDLAKDLHKTEAAAAAAAAAAAEEHEEAQQTNPTVHRQSLRRIFRSATRNTYLGISVSAMAVIIVRCANFIERLIPQVPGMACAVIAVVAPFINNYFTNRFQGEDSAWTTMQRIAGPVGDLCFHWLFAAIGTGANIQQALITGPACLLFVALAVTIHVGGTFLGCNIAQRMTPYLRKHMELEDVLIASNAAIGGPATAAVFCRGMKGPRVRGWTMAATVWGVVGYAVGTTIGVAMFRLSQFLSP